MNQTNLTSQKRKPAPPANPLVEGAKIILGSGFGLFFAVLLLSYFWGIDLLGMQGKAKRDQQQVASSSTSEPAAPVTPTPAPPKEKTPTVKRAESSKEQASQPEKQLKPPPVPREVIEAAVKSSPTPVKPNSPQPDVDPVPPTKPAPSTEDKFPPEWSGESKITSGPGAGDDCIVTLHIGSRLEGKFQGKFCWKNLRSNNEGEYPVEGTINGSEITWKWDGDGKATGKVADGVITASWQEGRMEGSHLLRVTK